MIVHQVFAIINEGEVSNIIVIDSYAEANKLAKELYGETAYAVECTRYPVAPGYKHIDNFFYRPDGITLVDIAPTAEEEARQAVESLDNLTLRQADAEIDADLRISLLELGML